MNHDFISFFSLRRLNETSVHILKLISLTIIYFFFKAQISLGEKKII